MPTEHVLLSDLLTYIVIPFSQVWTDIKANAVYLKANSLMVGPSFFLSYVFPHFSKDSYVLIKSVKKKH